MCVQLDKLIYYFFIQSLCHHISKVAKIIFSQVTLLILNNKDLTSGVATGNGRQNAFSSLDGAKSHTLGLLRTEFVKEFEPSREYSLFHCIHISALTPFSSQVLLFSGAGSKVPL